MTNESQVEINEYYITPEWFDLFEAFAIDHDGEETWSELFSRIFIKMSDFYYTFTGLLIELDIKIDSTISHEEILSVKNGISRILLCEKRSETEYKLLCESLNFEYNLILPKKGGKVVKLNDSRINKSLRGIGFKVSKKGSNLIYN